MSMTISKTGFSPPGGYNSMQGETRSHGAEAGARDWPHRISHGGHVAKTIVNLACDASSRFIIIFRSENAIRFSFKRRRGIDSLRRFAILMSALLVLSHLASAQIAPPNRTKQPAEPVASGQSQQGGTPSLLTPLKPQELQSPYHPITPRESLRWFITNTAGPPHLAGGVFAAGFGTALDRPVEYGPHWGGFASRYGMRMTGIVTGNAAEAGLGLLLGEDPRYFRVQDRPFQARVKNIVLLTFAARRRDGSIRPAYARYVAISGNNFLSNTWRVPSESNVQDALLRTAEGFAGRMVVNAFEEFWPDFKKRIFHWGN